MASYIPIGTGYTPIGGKPFVSPKKKFPHLKGEERRMALLDQEMNPRRQTQQGYGGLADMYAANAIDPITNLPVSMSEFDLANVRNNLAKAGEIEALNLFNNYQQKLPGSAEALMEFRNMRKAQQQFAQRPQQTASTTPQNPYNGSQQGKTQMFVPTSQPQPPSNVPQLASGSSEAIGKMLASAMPKQRPSGAGVNIDPNLWTPEAIRRANPYTGRPLPTHPNDMRGQSRGYGLAYSSGGASSIAPAGGKIAGWSPTYSGDRQVASPSASLPSSPYQAAPAQPAPFDMQAAVARNRAALDAKYPTPQSPSTAGTDYVTARPQPQTPRLLSANPYNVVNKTPSELLDSGMLNMQGARNLAAPPASIRNPSYYTGTSPSQNAVPLKPFNDQTPNVAGIAPYRNPVALAGLGLENAKQVNFQGQVDQLNRDVALNQAQNLEVEAMSPARQFARGLGGVLGEAGSAVGTLAGRLVNPFRQKTYDAIGNAAGAVKNFLVDDKAKLAAAAALRKKYR